MARRIPLFASVQTRDSNPIGALGFAFVTWWRTPAPRVGTGVLSGSLRAEGGRQSYQPQGVETQGLGGIVTGTTAMQSLSGHDYVRHGGE